MKKYLKDYKLSLEKAEEILDELDELTEKYTDLKTEEVELQNKIKEIKFDNKHSDYRRPTNELEQKKESTYRLASNLYFQMRSKEKRYSLECQKLGFYKNLLSENN